MRLRLNCTAGSWRRQPVGVAGALRSSAGANKHGVCGTSGMNLRALRTLKREAKSTFTFVSERGAPLHLALAGQSIPLSSWRRRRVQLLATNKHASAHADPPPMLTGRGPFVGAETPSKIPGTPKWGLSFA